MPRANTVVDVMLGEAGGRTPQQRYNDMLHVASTMVNRARLLGQPLENIALNTQYNAYGQPLPPGVEAYRSLAEQALTQVLEEGPVTEATFYATPSAVQNLPGGLAYSTETDSHRYFTDPQMRSIYTSDGYKSPVAPEIENAPTPTFAERWQSAAPVAVESAELAPAGGLLNPSMDEDRFASAAPVAQGLDAMRAGLLSANAEMGAPDDARFASGPVAQGLDGLRAGLLSQQPGSMYASQPQMADMQDRANLQADVNEMRGAVTPQSAGLMSFAETPTASPAAAAIQTVSPSPAAPPAPSLANAYADMARTMDQAGVLGLSGQKTLNPLSPVGELNTQQAPTGLLSAAQPTQEMGDYRDPSVSVQGPVSPATETQQGPTPAANVGSFPSAPSAPSTFGQRAKGLAGTVAGGLLGSAAAGPIGGLLGGLLGREMAAGKGLFSSRAPAGADQGIRGLLSGSGITSIGSGPQASYSVWGGGTPTGSQATATDGSRITSLGNGLIARTDPNGVTTTFNDRGNIVGSPASTGGLLAGIGRDISDAFGGGGSSGAGGVDTSGMSPGLW